MGGEEYKGERLWETLLSNSWKGICRVSMLLKYNRYHLSCSEIILLACGLWFWGFKDISNSEKLSLQRSCFFKTNE